MKSSLLRKGVALLLVVAWGSIANAGLETDALGARPTLTRQESYSAHPTAWWVLFRDKEVSSLADIQGRLGLYPEGKSRGRRIRAGLPTDGLDVPVVTAYLHRLRDVGAQIRVVSRWLNAASVVADRHQLEEIRRLPAVAGIVPVARGRLLNGPGLALPAARRPAESAGSAAYPFSYGLGLLQVLMLNVPELHALTLTGRDVLIAVFDTGFRTDHDALTHLEGRILSRYDFIFADTTVENEPADTSVQDRHGSQVLGALAGFQADELIGPAFGADFLLAKTEDIRSETPIEEDYYVAALEWSDSLGADIVTSSLSYDFGYIMDGTQGISSLAANAAASRGILLCTAMGNRGPGTMTLGAPADAFGIVAVGAVDETGAVAGFSSRGPTADGRTKPEVCAPGVGVHTVVPGTADTYTDASGTSFATPLTAAAAALLLEAHPDWAPLMVREALMQSGDHAAAPDNDFGWGVFDLLTALDHAPFGALQLTLQGESDRYDLNPWPVNLRATAAGDRLPQMVRLHYSYGAGHSDSVLLTGNGDTLWSVTLPYAAEDELRYHFTIADQAGRRLRFPAANRSFEQLRQPDSVREGFEYGGLRWERGGSHALFRVSALDAAVGTFSLTDSPRGPYPPLAEAWCQTRYPFLPGSDGTLQFSFQTRHQFALGDSAFVEWRRAPADPWETVDTLSGTESAWTLRAVNLTVLATDSLQLRFRLRTDASGEGDGWYIDDLRLGPVPTGVREEPPSRPLSFRLRQNRPNPFNPSTQIEFELSRPGRVRLSVYNVAGRRVRLLAERQFPSGAHKILWDGTDDRNREVTSGVYFYRLETDLGAEARKMLLLR